jgi:Undecaprenyl-phosphate galactose phosphotransferase WbaP
MDRLYQTESSDSFIYIDESKSMTALSSFFTRVNKLKITTFGGYRLRMGVFMFFADLTGMLLAVFLGHLFNGERFNFLFFNSGEFEHTLSIAIRILLFIFSRLYPGIGINPAEEIKLVVRYSILTFFITIMTIFIMRPSSLDIFTVPLYILVLSIVTILLMRWSVRIFATHTGIWGEPVVILARGSQIDYLTRYFSTRGRLGFIPVIAVTDSAGKKANTNPVSVIDLHRLITDYPIKHVETILIDASFFGRNLTNNSYKKLNQMFKHVIFVSDMSWLEGASLAVRDFEGLTGIEAHKDRLNPPSSIFKRGMDILGSIFGVLLLSPFLVLISILIKLDSPGPVIYSQERITIDRRKKKRPGKHQHKVYIYKFRTMRLNAEQALAEYLANNPKAQQEWDQNQKLYNDPRITRVGKWLRKFSIDEIPQVINVFKGEMSLVGPRPLPSYHHELLSSDGNKVRDSVRPGLTGLWQISGRSNVGTVEMERLDSFYVHNWSPWLDIYIILRTIWVVLSRDGAY